MLTAFVDMLNALRFGRVEETTLKAFKSLARSVEYTDGIVPTDLLVHMLYIFYFCLTLSCLLSSECARAGRSIKRTPPSYGN
jgi:hypothetical protein